MSVYNLLRGLSGRSNRRFVELLLAAVDKTSEGASIVSHAVSGDLSAAEAVSLMYDVEHQGDELRRQLVALMNESIVTPIDREDLNRLSRSIDDVLDMLRDFLRLWRDFDMKRSLIILPVTEVIVQAVGDFRTAIEIVVESPGSIGSKTLDAKKAGINSVRRTHDYQLAALYRESRSKCPIVMTLKIRDLLRRLDVVGLRLTEAADHLADAAVKRSDS